MVEARVLRFQYRALQGRVQHIDFLVLCEGILVMVGVLTELRRFNPEQEIATFHLEKSLFQSPNLRDVAIPQSWWTVSSYHSYLGLHAEQQSEYTHGSPLLFAAHR